MFHAAHVAFAAACASFLGAVPTSAQQFAELQFEGHPTVYPGRDGRPAGCGVRGLAVEMASRHPPRGQTVDASFVLDTTGFATIKVASRVIDPAVVDGAALRRVKVDAAWRHAPGFDKTEPLQGKSRSSKADADALLYVSPFGPALAVAVAIEAGTEVHVAIQRRGEATHHVYGGTVDMSSEERARFARCVSELVAIIGINSSLSQAKREQ